MPALSAETTDYRLGLEFGQRSHWFIGRDPACELLLRDEGISRFHATVFHLEGHFYVIDHSLNGTHLFRGEEEVRLAHDAPRPALESRSDQDADVVGFETTEIDVVEFLPPTVGAGADESVDIHRSYMELRIMQKQSRVPSLAGHQPHEFSSAGAVVPLLAMIHGESDLPNLASMGRIVEFGDVLLFHGFDRHFFRFED